MLEILAKETIKKHRPYLFVEFEEHLLVENDSSEALLKKQIEDLGYIVKRFQEGIPYQTESGKCLDCVCIPIEKESLNQYFLGIGFPLNGHDDENRYVIKLISAILSGSMSSRLFMELREQQGLVYSIKTDISNYYQGGVFYILTSFDKDYYLKVISSILEQLKLLIKKRVSNDEINVWKNNIKNSLVIEFENTMEVADYYAKQMLFYRNNITEYSSLNDKFLNITDQDILNISNKIFDFKKMKTILVGNFGNEQKTIIENITKIIKSHL